MKGITLAEFCNVVRFKVNNADVDKVNSTINNIKSMAQNLLGAIGIGISLTAMNALVEEFGRVNDQIKNSTAQLGDQHDVQQKILESATATRSEYAQTARVISDLVHENSELFGSIDEAAKFNNAATMLFKSAGKTNAEIAGLMEAINKSFAKGYIDSETLSQLLERSPEAVELINKKLGTTSDQLESLASDGIFTVTHLKEAFTDNADEIERKFSNVKLRITDALTIIRNRWGFWLTDLNETTNLTDQVSRVMISGFDKLMGFLTRVGKGFSWVNNLLGGMGNTLRMLALLAAAFFLAFKMDKLTDGIANVLKHLKSVNTTALATMAKFLLLFLLVEDFIKFMQGEDSLLGSFLEAAGIDTDDFREKITTAFQSIRDFVLPIWEGFVEVFSAGMAVVSELWDEYGDDIMSGIGLVISTVGDAITSFLTWITGSEDAKDVLHALGEVIGFIVAALTIAIPLIAVIEGAIALLSSPVFLVIAAIIALITIIHLLIENWDAVVAAAQNCWEWIKETWEGVADWFNSNVVEPIAEFFGGLIEDAVTWGADIMSSIVDGINSGIQWVVDAVSGVAQDIKDFLGFSEPEKGPLSNFHTYMPDMVDLMTKGIRDGRAKVQAAVGEVAADLAILANANTVSPRSASTAMGGSTTKNVTQNVEINNKFEGDVAAQRHAAGAMKKSAKDTTYEMAKALSMT